MNNKRPLASGGYLQTLEACTMFPDCSRGNQVLVAARLKS